MVSKTTQRVSEVKTINIYVLVAILFFNLNIFSQTITDVFPTRVTSGSEITVLGSGFTAPTFDVNNIAITGVSIDVSSITIVSDTELKFSINDTYSYESPAIPDPSDALNRVLTVGGGSTSSPKLIDYISPTLKDYQDNDEIEITEIFTDWDYVDENGVSYGYFRSSWYRDVIKFETYPNGSHDLLAFTIEGVTYSTGVNDALLDDKGITYVAQDYKAYSTNGVVGFPNRDNYLLMADNIDGVIDGTVLNNQVSATAYDVIIDGVNGLDLGTGIANFNKETSVRFFSGNGIFGAVTDNIPDLVITQIANSNGKNTDVYYYADIDGDIIGRPVRLRINNNAPRLYKWQLDIFTMNNAVPFEISYPTGAAFRGNEKRLFRMVGLKLSDFGIDDNSSGSNFIGNINNINTLAGGSADMAFMAYNKAAFDIKSPVIDQFPLARNICKVPSDGNSIEFSALGSVDSPSSPVVSDEIITYEWFKDFLTTGVTTSTFILPSTINPGDLGNYKVRISNGFGAVDLPVSLTQGGTPTFWNGASWELPAAYTAAGITVNDDERNLIFSEDYSESIDIEGCDCRVLRDRVVSIPPGRTLKLYGDIIVEEDLDIYDEFGVFVETIDAGQITFGDDATLLQTKAVSTNTNSGAIRMNRNATNLNTFDYIYWSSPVANFDIGNIPGAFTYKWSVNTMNVNSTRGDWITASGIMNTGEGYIKRVPTSTNFTTTFTGIPNNGSINVGVFKSDISGQPLVENRHWNLLGNPYPSSINATTFLTENTNIEGSVHIWTRGTGISNNGTNDPYYNDFDYTYDDEYVRYNGTGSTPANMFDGKIASGQGFFVQVLDASPLTSDVTFNNAMRYDGSENAYDNSEFFRSSSSDKSSSANEVEKQLIWLGLVNERNSSSVALLGYVDGATNGIDRMYDARRTGENMSIYTVLEDTKMTIQGRSYPFDNTDTIALGVDLLEDGIYKIAIDNLEGSVFEDEMQGIYLEDTYLDVVHDLRDAPYGFTGVAGTTKDRFVLRYTSDQELSVEKQNKLDTFIYVVDERLYVKSTKNIESIVLYDVSGRQVVTYKLDTNVSRSFNTPFQYPRGAYIAVINLDNNVAIGRKIIN